MRAISTSKMINKTPRKKNRMENGARALEIGSNPHSNVDSFSRFRGISFIISKDKIKSAVGIIDRKIQIIMLAIMSVLMC